MSAGWPRMLLRLVQIWLIAGRHLLGAGWEATRRWVTRRRGEASTVGPVRLRRAFEDLGVGFVKLGQLLSSRADLLPEGYRLELARLRDNVRPVPLQAVIKEIEACCGRRVGDAFTFLSPEPVAAASVSQVHAGTLPDGRKVAIKVRRPGIVPLAEADIALLTVVARVLHRASSRARLVGLAGMVGELGMMIRREMDFVAEGRNATTIRELFSSDPSVVVPEIITTLSGPTVIVMSYIDGISLTDVAALEEAGCSRRHLAASVIRANVAMVLGPSLFHADLHPGNLLALPGGRLALLDFGAAGSATSESTTAAVTAVVEAMASGDADALTDGVLLMTSPTGPVDRAQLSRELEESLLVPLGSSSLGALQVGQLLRDLVGVMRRHGLRVNPEMTLLLRAVMTCEATAQELDPEISFRRVVVPFLVDRAFGFPALVAGVREEPPQVVTLEDSSPSGSAGIAAPDAEGSRPVGDAV